MASTGSAVLIAATAVQPDGKIIVGGHNKQHGEVRFGYLHHGAHGTYGIERKLNIQRKTLKQSE